MDSQSTYTEWSNTDLIKRVTELETQLRARTIANKTPVGKVPHTYKKQIKKPNRFDPSKYNTRLIALKFAYLGKRYNGYEHHVKNKTPLPTIEEKLWKALMKTKLIFPDFKERSEDEVCWEGCEYSKCGRTDRGVSAFGQVIGVRVRSNRPKQKPAPVATDADVDSVGEDYMSEPQAEEAWDPVADELPYIQLLNRVLPTDIRILAWCPDPPPDFSARFNCKERRYRYFFSNPAYAPTPTESRRGGGGGAWLNIEAMREAAKKLEGVHDFRNLCKVDASKQITDFKRRIFHADVVRVLPEQAAVAFLDRAPFGTDVTHTNGTASTLQSPELYYFEVHGSAFLWHQVRHMVAVLLLVGQGHEQPTVIDDLVDVQKTEGKPVYEMASDTPLVLWECIFPAASDIVRDDHAPEVNPAYVDALPWRYIGDHASEEPTSARLSTGVEDRKFGRISIMEDLWAMWHIKKLDELLAGLLMDNVARSGKPSTYDAFQALDVERSARVVDGSGDARTVGRYIPVMQRERLDTPDTVNARYAARKGLQPKADHRDRAARVDADADE